MNFANIGHTSDEARGTIDSNTTDDQYALADIGPEQNEDLRRSSLLYEFEEVWGRTQGQGVKVAVLDTGIDFAHPAFFGAVKRAVRILDGNEDVVVDNGVVVGEQDLVQDENGHGTHCAGIIAGRPLGPDPADVGRWIAYEPVEPSSPSSSSSGSGLSDVQASSFVGQDGVAADLRAGSLTWRPVGRPDEAGVPFADLRVQFSGVAPLVDLMVYKVTRGDSRTCRVDDLALAIDSAANSGAEIISISIQSDEGTLLLYESVHRALFARRMVVCSAGNRGALRQINVGYPGGYGGVITVAAHDRFGQTTAFSSSGGEIDMSAPGDRVWSTWPGEKYRSMSGTSMAAPWVAGLAALVVSKHKKGAQRRQALKQELANLPADDKCRRKEIELELSQTNATPLRHNEELREHLLRMAAHRGHYEPRSGYGPLWPGNYFARLSN